MCGVFTLPHKLIYHTWQYNSLGEVFIHEYQKTLIYGVIKTGTRFCITILINIPTGIDEIESLNMVFVLLIVIMS